MILAKSLSAYFLRWIVFSPNYAAYPPGMTKSPGLFQANVNCQGAYTAVSGRVLLIVK